MKILAFTDLHGNESDLRVIIEKSKKEDPDLLICCGDLSFFGGDLDHLAKKLNSLGKKVLIVPGNHESEEQIKRISSKYKNIINIHKGLFEFYGHLFFGYGEGGFAKIDERFEKITEKLEKDLDKEKPFIVVFHGPPHKTALDLLEIGHVGNKSYRKFVEKVSPMIVFSGHIHENDKKQDKIKKSLIINPGSDGTLVKI